MSGSDIGSHTFQRTELSSYKTKAQRLRALETANRKLKPLNLGIVLKLSSRLEMLRVTAPTPGNKMDPFWGLFWSSAEKSHLFTQGI